MHLNFLSRQEKKKFIEQLNEQFGITDLPFLLVHSGKEKIRAISCSLSTDELRELSRNVNIDAVGIYLLKIEPDGLRLSIEATHMLKEQIKKNILELNKSQVQEWLRGNDVEVEDEQTGYVVIKHKEDFYGCGKLSNKILRNFVPKERRIKN
ncbi:hypothetical protein COV15_00105 [Candidatus Woesearchaeota archaeon CG10_big_fil_rev_8_21_14_0_10_34_12]|nr:MAG: hypothetical protein COV15_00105 [Candidatus Woesearchaeota archaeon CG10_big_fil_rev_8_21_14_0_10_34_12]